MSLDDPLYTTLRGVPVRAGADAGAYYCEHAFWLAQHAASWPDASLVATSEGEPLVGFLHVPGVLDRPGVPDRHADTAEVVARALAGYADAVAAAKAGGDTRLLLTGFGPFEEVADNPTGDLVGRRDALVSVLRAAFRAAPADGAARGVDAALTVQSSAGRVVLGVRRLPVTPAAIDDGPSSLQRTIADFRPHAVLSLGVSRRADHFVAETVATPRHLAEHGGPSGLTGRRVNRSLATALQAGPG